MAQTCNDASTRTAIVALEVESTHSAPLLCHRCNVGLGWFEDDPTVLENAARYLSESNDAPWA